MGARNYSDFLSLRSEVNVVFNPFLANAPILYPLKTQENLWFSGVFRGYKTGHWSKMG